MAQSKSIPPHTIPQLLEQLYLLCFWLRFRGINIVFEKVTHSGLRRSPLTCVKPPSFFTRIVSVPSPLSSFASSVSIGLCACLLSPPFPPFLFPWFQLVARVLQCPSLPSVPFPHSFPCRILSFCCLLTIRHTHTYFHFAFYILHSHSARSPQP